MSVRIKTLAFISSAAMMLLPFAQLYMAVSARYDDSTLVSVISKLPARSGSLLDRNGKALAYDKPSNEVILLPQLFTDNEEVNATISRLITSGGKKVKATLPVDRSGIITGSDDQTALLKTAAGLDTDDGSALLDRLYKIFHIDDDDPNAYQIASVRYNCHIGGEAEYTLFKNISGDLLAACNAESTQKPFVRVNTTYTRKYTKTPIAPHIIKECEQQYEKSLSGTDGNSHEQYRVLSRSAELVELNKKAVTNGEDIRLTIDSDYQIKIQKMLTQAISDGKCDAGSVCVCDAKNGEVLACASAPYFDMRSFSKDYDTLSQDSGAPLFDRALWGLYRPGSAMKTITAFAAIDSKMIDKDTNIWCGKWYPLGDTTFSCLYYHGFESVQTALRDSCNVFFYKCSQLLGQDKLSSYQQGFGLGKSIPCGLDNAAGRVVTPESVSSLGIVWSEGLLLQSAIGQSENAVTPLQMTQWAMMIANKGELIPPTLIKGQDYAPTQVYENTSAFEEVKAGMILAADNIYGEDSLASLPEKTAIKTGTPESGSGYDSTVIGFYPADDPKIAFSVVLEDSEQAKSLIKGIIENAPTL